MSGIVVDVELQRTSRGGDGFQLRASFEAPCALTVVFGPSGAGKSTLLAAVLGELTPDRGTIVIAGDPVFDGARGRNVAVRRRGVGIVFQDALLFPHLSVEDNVAFGARGPGRKAAAGELLARVGAAELARRRPVELSGGQRQRVALARALAARPRALLLDEPFSAVDLAGRQRLGRLLVDLQREFGIPFLHVTHDLGEAIRLGTTLVLLLGGRVVQCGPPERVVAAPATLAAARAMGTENLFSAKLVAREEVAGCAVLDIGGTRVRATLGDEPVGAKVPLALRAEDVLLSLAVLEHTSARNVIAGVVERLEWHGRLVEVIVRTPVRFRVIVTPASAQELELAPGRTVYLVIKAAAFHRLA